MIFPWIGPLVAMMLGRPPSGEGNRVHDNACGGHALATALRAMDRPDSDVSRVLAALGKPGDGYTLAALESEAKRRGLHTAAVRTTIENLQARRPPFTCIAALQGGHYVLLFDIADGQVRFVDYPQIHRTLIDAWEALWTRDCLLLSPQPLEAEEAISARILLRRILTRGVPGLILTLFALTGVRRLIQRRKARQRPTVTAPVSEPTP